MVTARHHEDSDSEKGGKKGPPPGAIEACTDLTVDAACQFEGRRGSVSGTCIVPPEDP